MLAIDIIGMLMTICIIGIRYPHYVVIAALAHQFGQIIMALFVQGQIDTVIASGAFGSIVVSQITKPIFNTLILFSGSLVNYMLCGLTGGVEFEPTWLLVNPLARLKYPFSVINLRFAVITFFINIFSLL